MVGKINILCILLAEVEFEIQKRKFQGLRFSSCYIN